MIHTLTFRMTGSLADCKDLAQETFVRAYRQLDSFHGTAKFFTASPSMPVRIGGGRSSGANNFIAAGANPACHPTLQP
jgi:hypothetical protein